MHFEANVIDSNDDTSKYLYTFNILEKKELKF